MTRVSITRVGDNAPEAFALAMTRAGLDDAVQPGQSVLIKPNWFGCSAIGSTSIDAVEAACLWARDRGAREVVVGEGPVPVGREAFEAILTEMNARPRVEAAGARFVCFDDEEHEMFRDLPDLPKEIGVARRALETDVLINFPLLKVHSCCVTTLAVKNLKGVLRPDDKMAFHRRGLLHAVVALNRLVRSPINVIDAIDAMEGNHCAGNLIHLGLLIAGADRVAVDTVGSAQAGIEPGKVPLLRLAAEAGIGTDRMNDIELVGEPLEPRHFMTPQESLARDYPDLEIQRDAACSACEAALLDGLYTAGGSHDFRKIAMGARAKPEPGTLVLGKCLRKYRDTNPHVEGCPPSGADVARALRGEQQKEEQ